MTVSEVFFTTVEDAYPTWILQSILGRVLTETAQLYLPLSPHAREQEERVGDNTMPFLSSPDLVYPVEFR